MNKATYVAAVTETKPVELAPAHIVLKLTPREATVLLALLAPTAGNAGYATYYALDGLAEAGYIARPNRRIDALEAVNTDNI